jgi:cell division protein ZipA
MGVSHLTELRWALLILGVVFFAGLTLWELRRPRQARNSEPGPTPTRPREVELELPEMHAREPIATGHLPLIELPDDPAAFPVLVAAPAEEGAASAAAPAELSPEPAASAQQEAPVEADSDLLPESALSGESRAHNANEPRVDWPPDEERRVVALRLVAPQPERFAGRSLRQALAAEGFVLGRFDIFHKGDEERRAVLSAASLTQPGTFDAQTMDSQHFGGLSLFAVLPGPMSPPQAFEELVTTARSLNDRLCGVLQDERGLPLTPARIASLRERLAAGASS